MIYPILELPIRISDVSTWHQSIFVTTWLNSLMPRGWNTPWRLYSWEFSHANSIISLSWYPIPIWLDPPPAYIRATKRLWLNKHSLSYLRHWELKKHLCRKQDCHLFFPTWGKCYVLLPLHIDSVSPLYTSSIPLQLLSIFQPWYFYYTLFLFNLFPLGYPTTSPCCWSYHEIYISTSLPT